jgi:hypothetical protein
MRRDPELVAETRAWLVKANGDLGAAAHEFKAEPPFLTEAARRLREHYAGPGAKK